MWNKEKINRTIVVNFLYRPIIKRSIFPVLICVVMVWSYFYYSYGALALFSQTVLYSLIISFIAFLTFKQNDYEKQVLYATLAFTIFATFLPFLTQKDFEIRQLIATNEFNCKLTVDRAVRVLSDFAGGSDTKFEKQYVIDGYSSNLGYLVSKDASTTLDLMGKLQSQNALLTERNEAESDSYKLLMETNYLQKMSVQEQEIYGLDYFFLLDAKSIVADIQILQKDISGNEITGCNLPEISSQICAYGIVKQCWSN